MPNCPQAPHRVLFSCIILIGQRNRKSHSIHPNPMTYNQDFVEARAEDIFEDWVKSFFVDLTPLDESALYALALDTAIEEAL